MLPVSSRNYEAVLSPKKQFKPLLHLSPRQSQDFMRPVVNCISCRPKEERNPSLVRRRIRLEQIVLIGWETWSRPLTVATAARPSTSSDVTEKLPKQQLIHRRKRQHSTRLKLRGRQ